MSTAHPQLFLGIPRPDAVWLLYLAFLFFQPLFDPTFSARDWALIVVAIGLFVPLYGFTHRVIAYRPYFWRSGTPGVPGALLGILAIALMGTLFVLANSGATVFSIYAAAATGKLKPRRLAYRMLIAVLALLVLAFLLSPVPLGYRFAAFTPALVFAPIIALANMHERERRESAAKLRMAQEQVEHLATIAERERIARDLHDLLGHTLSTITLKSELAARLVGKDPERAEREMRDVERLSRETLSEVRAAVRGYRQSGVEAELANAKLALEAAGMELDYFLEPVALRPEVEGVFAVALREGVTNVIRHAQARTCQITLVDDGAFVLLAVADDGVGVRSEPSGTGLEAMRERVRALGGAVTLTRGMGGADQGTRLEVTVPRRAALVAEAGADSVALKLAHS